MTALLNCNLTSYTQFRQLQFDFSKLKDQNQVLKSKLNALENLYQQSSTQIHKIKQEERTKLNQKEYLMTNQKKNISKIASAIHQSFLILKQMKHLRINSSDKNEEPDLINKIHLITQGLIESERKNSAIISKYDKCNEELKQIKEKTISQQQSLHEQISYLQAECQKLDKQNRSMNAQLSLLRRQNLQCRQKLNQYANKIEKSNQQPRNELIDDNDFALEVLNYEKELLQRVFTRVISTFKSNSISEMLCQVYGGYESVFEAYRQKIQIQYDLQDLEKQYKKEKNNKVSESLLIQLRKQIEDFRNELHHQKTILAEEENKLEEHMLNLQSELNQDDKIRHYAVEIQKKLKDNIRTNFETKREEEKQQREESKKPGIRFKASDNSEQMMKQILKKDRDNIEKILKETKSLYLKNPSI